MAKSRTKRRHRGHMSTICARSPFMKRMGGAAKMGGEIWAEQGIGSWWPKGGGAEDGEVQAEARAVDIGEVQAEGVKHNAAA